MLSVDGVVTDSALEPATVSENCEKLEKSAGVTTVADAAAEAVIPADEAVTF